MAQRDRIVFEFGQVRCAPARSSESLPRAISSQIDGVVATTFVSDAASKIVSYVIRSVCGTTARLPHARTRRWLSC
jgi:hypothetical protein